MLNKRVLLASLVISSMVCRGVAGNIKKYFLFSKTGAVYICEDKPKFFLG